MMNGSVLDMSRGPSASLIGIWGVRLVAILALLFSAWIALVFLGQPLIDMFAFRQTQTALTTFWMAKEGWSLAYQTPVAGYPWSIPFEFPIYQALSAAVSRVFGLRLTSAGRLTSYLFLLACAWPALQISRRLKLAPSVPWVFVALLWTSPLYVYWGRSFMIETAAVFFALACVPYAIDLIHGERSARAIGAFLAFATAATLQKITTVLTVLVMLLCVAAVAAWRDRASGKAVRGLRLLEVAVIIAIPLVVGAAWTHFTDVVKEQNPFGRQLTSSALTSWNFGTLAQRLDPNTWRLVLWERSVGPNAGGVAGALLLILPWLGPREHRRVAWIVLAAVALFVLPFLVVTNLHVVHEYYQVSCVVFLLAGLAVAIGDWLTRVTQNAFSAAVVTAVMALSNVNSFTKTHMMWVDRTVSETDPSVRQIYEVANYLRDRTPPKSGLVIFGQDWSSELAFAAQRKSMTVPPFFREYRQLWKTPAMYLGNVPLGAVVICPVTDGFPNRKDVQERLASEPGWAYVRHGNCDILLPTRDGMGK
jgi:hypothetical protein